MATLTREDFVLTWRAEQNPAAHEIETAAAGVARALGALTDRNVDRFAGFNALVSYVYPTARIERAVACAGFCNLLFMYDDTHDEERDRCADVAWVRETMEGHLHLLATGERLGAPSWLDRYALDFRRRALDLAGPVWLSRLCRSVGDYFFKGALPAVESWVDGRVLGVDTFLPQREHDSAVHTAIDLIELAEGIVLPEAFLESSPVRRMRTAAVRTIALFNDIVSYAKEVPELRNPNNLVHVIMVERRCSYEDALMASVDVVNAYAREMIEVEPEVLALRSAPAADARRFTEGMRRWQRGNVESSLASSRYASATSPFEEMRPAPISKVA